MHEGDGTGGGDDKAEGNGREADPAKCALPVSILDKHQSRHSNTIPQGKRNYAEEISQSPRRWHDPLTYTAILNLFFTIVLAAATIWLAQTTVGLHRATKKAATAAEAASETAHDQADTMRDTLSLMEDNAAEQARQTNEQIQVVRDQVDASVASNKIAREAMAVQRDIGQKVAKAYLALTEVQIRTNRDGGTTLRLTIANYGQSAATDVSVSIALTIYTYFNGAIRAEAASRFQNIQAYGVVTDEVYITTPKIPTDAPAKWPDGPKDTVLRIGIFATDIFGDEVLVEHRVVGYWHGSGDVLDEYQMMDIDPYTRDDTHDAIMTAEQAIMGHRRILSKTKYGIQEAPNETENNSKTAE